MDSELLNELVAVHLRYTAVARPLRTRAIAQLVAKVLYTLPSGQTAEVAQIAKDVAATVGVASIPMGDVTDGLRLLGDVGLTEKKGRRWQLSVRGNSEIEADLSRSRMLVDSILDRHFPQAVPRKQLRDWFRDACTDYFGRYGTYWAASICRVPAQAATVPRSWKGIIPAMARKHTIDRHIDALATGFANFLESSDKRDQEYLWSLGQAMFAARLIAAGVGADPITTREIRDSFVFLDTNVLLISSLEAHRYARSLEALGQALKSLNIRLVFLPITQSEYERVVAETRKETLRVVSRYPAGVIGKASDPFTRTARARGCSSVEDFERFFDEVGNIPSGLDDEQVEICQDEEMILAAERGATDQELQRQVAEAWRSMRPHPKPANAVMHDAALMRAIEDAIAKGQRSWVLTTDRTMNFLSARRSGSYGLPSWITLDALLQILAVDLAGPSLQAENFGPLLAAILENEAQPMSGAYTVQDLAWLLDIEERCADLPEQRVEACVALITQARMLGKRSNDPELQLDIQRAFQGDRLELVKEIGAAKVDLAVTKRDLEFEASRAQDLQQALISERTTKLRRQAWVSFAWKAVVIALWGVGCIAAGAWLALNSNSEDSTFRTIGLPALLFSAGVMTTPALWRQASRLRNSLSSACARAKEQVTSIGVTSDSTNAGPIQ